MLFRPIEASPRLHETATRLASSLAGLVTALAAPGAPGPATLGLRSEDLRIATHGWEAQAVRTEPHGADRYLTLEMPGTGAGRIVLRQYAGAADIPADGRVKIGFAHARAHLFGADGQRRDVRLRQEQPA